jgi:hypothetical protein
VALSSLLNKRSRRANSDSDVVSSNGDVKFGSSVDATSAFSSSYSDRLVSGCVNLQKKMNDFLKNVKIC